MSNDDSKTFFLGKATDYSKYRPGYPIQLFELLKEKYDLDETKVVVELGAGTGKFSKKISNYVKKVYAVEPNKDMLDEGIECCNGTNVEYVLGSAEETNLENKCADIVFAVQSFHWFNKENAKREVKRILKDDGLFAIVWNDWEDKNNEFSQVYFKYVSDWKTMITGKTYQHQNLEERRNFFANQTYETHSVIHSRQYTLNDLLGLTKSLSYAPKENEEYYQEFVSGVEDIFNKYSKEGYVIFDFHAEVFIGKV